MKLHPRTLKVRDAHREASAALADLWEKHDLTWGEIMAFHAQELARDAKYMIRAERHPDDPDKRGDEA